MSILVYPYNKQEEQALLSFLKSRHYNFKATDDASDENVSEAFLDQYNKELEEADAEVEAGEYISHDDVKKFLAERRKRISGN
jgi:isopentenyldiphosphate isomerase